MRRLCLAVLAVTLALPASASAIIGGRAATQPYPYMAALEYDSPGGRTEFSQVCGASLVAPDRVLTAAHCVVDDFDGNGSFEPVPASSMRLLLGTQRLDDRAGGETINAAEIIVHEAYLADDDASHDVAIIRLAKSATKGTPIRISSPATEKGLWAPGKIATLTGWGSALFRDPGLTYQNQLQEVQVPMRSDEECDRNYMLQGGIDPKTMVCAGELQGGKDSCQGDSGGPLVVSDANGNLVQAGVVSFGTGCGYPTQYGVYSRVGDTVLYDWIAARVPQPAPPTGGTGGGTSGGGTTGGDSGGGTTGGTSGGGTTGGSTGGGPTSAPTTTSASRGSSTYRRCMGRASRVKGITARRRATKRCQYAEQRRVAFRRCVKSGTSRKRCGTQRARAARRHARLVQRTR